MKLLVACIFCSAFISVLGNTIRETSDNGTETNNRIVGGTEQDKEGRYPWVVFIKIKDPADATKYIKQCSGVIINNQTVLTAADCVRMIGLTPGAIELYLGSLDITDPTQPPVIKTSPKNFTIHTSYKSNTQAYNIALLMLSSPILESTTGPYIKYLQLPTESMLKLNNTFANIPGTIYGFGETSEGGNPVTKFQFVHPRIMGQIESKSKLKEISYQLLDSMICTESYGGAKGACKFDIGAPLSAQLPSYPEPYLAGVLSYYDERCGTDYPMVFTKMGSKDLLKWIAKLGGPSIRKT